MAFTNHAYLRESMEGARRFDADMRHFCLRRRSISCGHVGFALADEPWSAVAARIAHRLDPFRPTLR
jgi:hypothetical protein